MGLLTGVEIRAMSEADLDQVASMEAANRPAPWSRSTFQEELARGDRIYLVATEGGEVRGFGGVMLVGEEAHVTNLLVVPVRRRQGVGGALMRSLVEAAVDSGARHLTLEVRTSNEAARALYSGMGLAPVGIRPGYYEGEDALILWAHDIDDPDHPARSRPR